MSWNINVTGKDKEAIKAAVNAEKYLPQQLKDLFSAQVERLKDRSGENFGIAVRSSGHHDDQYCYGDFKVEYTYVV